MPSAKISFHGKNSILTNVVLIRLRYGEDDDAYEGGHAEIDCHGDGDGNAHGDGGGYGATMASLMGPSTHDKGSQHCNLIFCFSRRTNVTT